MLLNVPPVGPAKTPTPVLEPPVVTLESASAPAAVLSLPVVSANNAPEPLAVLRLPVGLGG